MSAIIKSDSIAGLSAVRPLPITNVMAARQVLSQEDEEADRLRRRASALEEELHQRDAAIAKLRTNVDEAHERGRAQGYRSGLADADRRETDRLSLLEKAIGNAGAELKECLLSFDRLSALLARDSLDIILGNPDHRRELLGEIIAAEVAKIEKAALIEIMLSLDDFPDKDALSATAKRAGVGSAMLAAVADLPSGSCTMTLRLGRQEVGVNQQWGVLRERLEELSLPEEPA